MYFKNVNEISRRCVLNKMYQYHYEHYDVFRNDDKFTYYLVLFETRNIIKLLGRLERFR